MNDIDGMRLWDERMFQDRLDWDRDKYKSFMKDHNLEYSGDMPYHVLEERVKDYVRTKREL